MTGSPYESPRDMLHLMLMVLIFLMDIQQQQEHMQVHTQNIKHEISYTLNIG